MIVGTRVAYVQTTENILQATNKTDLAAKPSQRCWANAANDRCGQQQMLHTNVANNVHMHGVAVDCCNIEKHQ